MSIEKKLAVLKKLAILFNTQDITWNLGASCMLYLRGLVDHFDDIDIMIAESDVLKVTEQLSTYNVLERLPNEQYRTKKFFEYEIEGVDVDIMAGFIIVHKDTEHYFPITKRSPYDVMLFEGVPLRLASVNEWLTYYKLMERTKKVKLIEDAIASSKR